ncbi:MAG TPA: hypothetical protein VE443_03175 [Beijerinckiaceae bacterium]|jgi:hypothetical protein|nr:hypothetical protein [Beijerinckiaceae bacterium]
MPSARRDLWLFLALLGIVAATVGLAHVLPAVPTRTAPSTAAYGDQDKGCAEWTDGCIVCLRSEHAASCSTPGIACVRRPVECVRRGGS